ncbi:MAG: NAD(P)H-hydrate dehydratase [Candidatus Levybacteria bacterium]|nr:NAD(P)H-hydrate dehydratase [Candidatus Levybacteria bacterium]
MDEFNPYDLKKLYIPPPDSHKGQNGKVMVIGGSHLFHSSAFWALEIASKIIDMVYFSSTPMNNEIVKKLKTKFVNGIIVPRDKVEDYIEEADCILIGPGLPRPEGEEIGDDGTKILTEKLLSKFPHKKWVIDGGSLQVVEPELIPNNSIVTPHKKEFELLKLKIKNEKLKMTIKNLKLEEQAKLFAKEFGVIVLLKGPVDIVCSTDRCVLVEGGNAGMTKGGTGDVLAGLTAALYAKNDAFLSAICASFINKKAGESLAERVGLYFNASDLVAEIPKVMKRYI